jgi:acyl carrier protein
MATTYERVRDLLVARFQVDPARISPGATFDELDMDSLFLVEFLLTANAEFGAHIEEDAATPRDTIERAVQLIDEQLAAASSS